MLVTFNLTAQDDLVLADDDAHSIHEISLRLDPKKLRQFHITQGVKLQAPIDTLYSNGNAITAEFIRIRGSSSSHYYRKSFTVHLKEKMPLPGMNKPKTDKLYAISMNMDRNYIRNVLAYRVLDQQRLPTTPHAYANLLINQQSEGLYLMIYPSAEFALKEYGSTVVIRRGYDTTIDKTYSKKSAGADVKSVTQQYNSIYKKILPGYSGEALYNQLADVLDLEQYFTWMAFNHLFQNGDYSDEVFFLWNPDSSRFSVLAWDFDDLFHLKPHEVSGLAAGKPFIFSTEDKLDAAIAKDPYLYRKYLETYLKFLSAFTGADLKQILESVYREVSPYYKQPDIIGMSKYDKYGTTDLALLKKDITNIYLTIYLSIELSRQQLIQALK
jgi:spore coat protein H